MQYAAVHFCTCSLSICIIYIYVCSDQSLVCLVADNFGLFTKIAVCKFLHGLVVVWPETFLFCPLYVFIHFSAAFCAARHALD